jgi:hypothetical protein
LAPDDVQVIPVDVDRLLEPYCILVATRLIRCIDDNTSDEVLYWKPEDGRPEKVGKYRADTCWSTASAAGTSWCGASPSKAKRTCLAPGASPWSDGLMQG